MVMFTKIIVTSEKLIPIIKNNFFNFFLKKNLGRNYDHGFFNQLLKNIQEIFFGYFVGCSCCAQIVIVCKNNFLFKQFRVF